MSDLLAALCLVLVLEGMLPFLAPGLWRDLMREVAEMSDASLRAVGAVFMVAGLLLLIWVRS